MKRRPTAEAKHNQDERKPKQAKAKKRRKGRSKSKSRKQTKKAGAKAKAPNRLEKNNKKQTNDPVPIPKRGVDLCLLTPAWRNPDLSLSLFGRRPEASPLPTDPGGFTTSGLFTTKVVYIIWVKLTIPPSTTAVETGRKTLANLDIGRSRAGRRARTRRHSGQNMTK